MSAEIPAKVRAQIQRLRQLQDQLNAIILRKQQWHVRLSEINNALEELSKLKDEEIVYRIVGQVMIPMKKVEVVEKLSEEKELAEASMRTLDKQEKIVRKEIEELNNEIRREMAAGSKA